MDDYNVQQDKRKTSTFTLRIDEDIIKLLQNESQLQDISLNTLINKILKRYVEWDSYEPKVGMIPMAKPVITTLFNMMSEEEVSDLVLNFGKNVVQDIAYFMKMKSDPNSFLTWFEIRMRRSFVEFNHLQEDDNNIYILKHDLGYNWSLYHKKILEKIFNEVFNKPVKIAISNFMLTIQFDR
jgi:hypothetical protein